jgi:epoxyqueuosine reductase
MWAQATSEEKASEMTLTEQIKKQAIAAGFVCVGITSPEMLRGLPHGRVSNVISLRSPEEELKNVNSVILLAYYAWDKSFNLAVDSTYLEHRKQLTPKVSLERYQLYYEVLRNKAWKLVEYLIKKGYEACLSLSVPLKTSAVKCGIGSQGKNTLLITPIYGPRIRLIAVLTSAKLDTDEEFKDNLCGDCEKCISACPTKALEPYKIKINRCLVYAAEQPNSKNVPGDVRKIEQKLTQRPTANSYVECTVCLEACPIGRLAVQERTKN